MRGQAQSTRPQWPEVLPAPSPACPHLCHRLRLPALVNVCDDGNSKRLLHLLQHTAAAPEAAAAAAVEAAAAAGVQESGGTQGATKTAKEVVACLAWMNIPSRDTQGWESSAAAVKGGPF